MFSVPNFLVLLLEPLKSCPFEVNINDYGEVILFHKYVYFVQAKL